MLPHLFGKIILKPDINKQIIRRQLKDHDDTGYVDATPAQRIAMVWEITKNVWAFKDPNFSAEQPLQRHATKLIRRKH